MTTHTSGPQAISMIHPILDSRCCPHCCEQTALLQKLVTLMESLTKEPRQSILAKKIAGVR